MYTVSLERIPLPNLSTYVIFSILSFIGSILYIIHDAYEALPVHTFTNISATVWNLTAYHFHISTLHPFIRRTIHVILADTWCFWSVINLAYCGLILVGKTIQNIFFGELRITEQHHIRDKFWNFMFYKLVFIYGILNVQTLHELLLWAAWSSILGFLHLLTHLTKDRYDFVIQSTNINAFHHFKLCLLLFAILCSGGIMAAMSVVMGVHWSLHLMFFMLAEVLQLVAVTLYALLRYAVHFYDQRERQWRGRTVTLYYVDLYHHMTVHGLDFIHNLHMLLWNNVKVNMTGLVIGMHLQYLYYELVKRWKRHVRYKNVVKMLEENYPLLEKYDDNCSICWERLEVCRMLPCGHLFHDPCLRSWIEHNTSCPTCRAVLEHKLETKAADMCEDTQHSQEDYSNTPMSNSSVYGTATQIQGMFPHVPLSVITKELHRCGSADEVVNSILEGRVHAPGPHLLTGPMQVELDARRGGYRDSQGSLGYVSDRNSSPAYNNDWFNSSKRRRENFLEKRKTQLINSARERFLKKHPQLS